MSPLALFIAVIIIASPIAWLASEYRGNRPLRIVLGILSLIILPAAAWTLGSVINRLNYNAWYGSTTGKLISTSIEQIEDGQLDRVLKIWRGLDLQYRPTYENRAHYDELVEQATERMRGDKAIEPGSAWNASPFSSSTWAGHWEDDYGYWLAIHDTLQPLSVYRSGDPPTKMHSVAVSPDFKVLTFKEGNRWSHRLTLKSKYEATHEWFDLTKRTVWRTDTMHKLIRPSPVRMRPAGQP